MARSMGMGPVGEIAAELAFNRLDKDKNGVLDPYEIYRAVGSPNRYDRNDRYALEYNYQGNQAYQGYQGYQSNQSRYGGYGGGHNYNYNNYGPRYY